MAVNAQYEAIINHAVSQLIYKWIPLLWSRALTPPVSRVDPRSLTLSDWNTYIQYRLREDRLAPWVDAMIRCNLSGIGVATVVFDNILRLTERGAALVDFFHPDYPYLLRHISDPPSCLTCLGDLSLLGQPKLAVVGSRKASGFAYQEARSLGAAFARRGTVVVSGGAIGCDAAAHLGALESAIEPVPTIVVFAGGLHRFYPQCLSSLFRSLEEGGALFVSERLWDYPARPIDFSVRNRIIAGLSTHLALMQAAQRSGALRTASYALEQGREVYALVHDEDDVRALGSKRMLDEGALPFHSADEFLSLTLSS